MNEMMACGSSEHLDEARVEAFLAPLTEVSPASRANGRRRARARVHRLIVMAILVIALGAGIAVAAENDPTATLIDTSGDATTVPLLPVAPPGAGDCQPPGCARPGGHSEHQSHPARGRS